MLQALTGSGKVGIRQRFSRLGETLEFKKSDFEEEKNLNKFFGKSEERVRLSHERS